MTFPKLYRIDEVCALLSIGKSKVYKLYESGVLVGPADKPVRVFDWSIREYLDRTNAKPLQGPAEQKRPPVKGAVSHDNGLVY